MPVTPRIAAQIRDEMLRDLRARMLALGEDVATEEGTPIYNEFHSFALALEPAEFLAGQAAARITLAGQFGVELDTSAADEGTTRLPASAARRVVRAVGPASTSTATNGATLSVGALRFVPVDADTGEPLAAVTTDGAGYAEFTVECETLGTDGNVDLGTVLTWSTAPTSYGSTALVITGAEAVDGEDVEDDNALRQRVYGLRRHRPGSGNPAEWRAWALACAGVGDAFVHPVTQPPDPPGRPDFTIEKQGCVSVIVVRPPPAADSYVQNADGTLGAGLDPTYSRRPSQGLCDNVAKFITGEFDSEGNPVRSAARRQLYPATIHRENWGVVRPDFSAANVTIGVITSGGTPDFAFDGTRTVTAAADATHVTLSSTSFVVVGTGLAFYFGAVDVLGRPSVIRGYWATAVVSAKSGADLTLATPLPAVPSVGALVRADPARLWRAISAVPLALIDSLGSGAPGGLGQSARYPDTRDGAKAAIVPSRLLTAVLAIPGIEDAEIVAPAATSALGLGVVAEPGIITIQRKLF